MRNTLKSRHAGWLAAPLAAAAALIAAAGATGRTGEEVVRGPLASTARSIKAALDDLPVGQRTVRVAPFVCPTDAHANGDLLARLLQDELKALGVEVKGRAAVGVSGEFSQETDPATRRAVVKFTINLKGPRGAIGKPFRLDFQEPEVVTLLFPDPYKANDPNRKKDDDPKKKDDPEPHFDGTKILASPAGKYAVEVLVVNNPRPTTSARDYKAVKPRLEEGRAFIDVTRGQAYAVRLINNSDLDAAVVLSIDGLHINRFLKDKAGKPKSAPAHLRVRKKDSAVVWGWRTSEDKESRFVVTERDLGAWKDADDRGDNVGRIVAQFHACWAKDDPRPDDEPGTRTAKASLKGITRGLATGQGDKIHSKMKVLPMNVGELRESIPVLYSKPRN